MPHHEPADDEKDVDATRSYALHGRKDVRQRTPRGLFKDMVRQHREGGNEAQMLQAIESGVTFHTGRQ
ncbi:hypothetical protein PSAC2689_20198 [Paraburkholderia sacchari]